MFASSLLYANPSKSAVDVRLIHHRFCFYFSLPAVPLSQSPKQMVDVSVSLRTVTTGADDEWFDRMAARYGSWVSASKFDVLTWGLFVFKKQYVSVG